MMETIGALIVLYLLMLAIKRIWKSTDPTPDSLEEFWKSQKPK